MPGMKKRPRARRSRQQLSEAIGHHISRFQESSNAFDDLAAEILAIDRRDLCVMTLLLFGGAATAQELTAALHARPRTIGTLLERLQLAGYARFPPGGDDRIELSDHAQTWIERIWAPLRKGGDRLLATYSTRQL